VILAGIMDFEYGPGIEGVVFWAVIGSDGVDKQ
jgi:hypothetical protein